MRRYAVEKGDAIDRFEVSWLVPAGADRNALPLLVARALRAFVDGYVAVLLPAYLLALGFGVWQVGLISTATLWRCGVPFVRLAKWTSEAGSLIIQPI